MWPSLCPVSAQVKPIDPDLTLSWWEEEENKWSVLRGVELSSFGFLIRGIISVPPSMIFLSYHLPSSSQTLLSISNTLVHSGRKRNVSLTESKIVNVVE